MSRVEFMNQLKNHLWDIPEGKREEILNYYEGYFDDAGSENEQQVIENLDSPEKVAAMIKEGLKDDAPKYEVIYYEQPKKKTFADRVKNLGTGGMILLLILAIFSLPILGPIGSEIVFAILGSLTTVVVGLFIFIIIGIALLAAGAGVFATAIESFVVMPQGGIMLLGRSMLIIGVGILITILGIKVVTKVIPKVIRWFVRLVHKIL